MDLWMLDIIVKTRRKNTSEQAQRISLPQKPFQLSRVTFQKHPKERKEIRPLMAL